MPKVLRDAQGLVGDALVEAEEVVQFVGRQEVPVGDRAAQRLLIGMVGDELFLDARVQAAVHAADPLHEADRVPVQVVVDEPGGVLKVEAFGEHVGGNQDARLSLACGGQAGAGRAVVVGGEGADDVAAVALGVAVDLVDALNAQGGEFALQVAGGVGELGEDQHLVLAQDRIAFEQLGEGLELVVVLRARTCAARGGTR